MKERPRRRCSGSDQPLTDSPFDAEVIADPYPLYRELRANAPAHWSRKANSWVLRRYDDVSAALADPATYSWQ